MSKRVLVPLDGSTLSEEALPHAFAIADGGTVRLVYVVHDVPGIRLPQAPGKTFADPAYREVEKMLEDGRVYLDQVVRRGGGKARMETEVLYGRPSVEIVQAAKRWPADFLVMSSHGRTGVDRWILGSVAERVWRTSPCPVMLMRSGAVTEADLRNTVAQQKKEIELLRQQLREQTARA